MYPRNYGGKTTSPTPVGDPERMVETIGEALEDPTPPERSRERARQFSMAAGTRPTSSRSPRSDGQRSVTGKAAAAVPRFGTRK